MIYEPPLPIRIKERYQPWDGFFLILKIHKIPLNHECYRLREMDMLSERKVQGNLLM